VPEVHAKAALVLVHVVADVRGRGAHAVAFDMHGVDSEGTRSERRAESNGGVALVFASARHDRGAFGGARASRDDVDDAHERVGPVERGARPRDHLDALDVFEHHLLRVPQHAGKHRRVEHAAVDEHEQLVGDDVLESARRDRVRRRAHARHLEVRREAQRFRKARGPRAADVLVGDDEDGGGRFVQALRPQRDGSDAKVAELFEREVREVRGGRRCLRVAGEGEEEKSRTFQSHAANCGHSGGKAM